MFHETVEPSIAPDTGGAQDLYPALGWRCPLQNSHVTNPSTSDILQAEPSVAHHLFHAIHNSNAFTLRPPASTILFFCDAHNLRLFAPSKYCFIHVCQKCDCSEVKNFQILFACLSVRGAFFIYCLQLLFGMLFFFQILFALLSIRGAFGRGGGGRGEGEEGVK